MIFRNASKGPERPSNYKNHVSKNIDFVFVYNCLTREQLNQFFQFCLETVNCTNNTLRIYQSAVIRKRKETTAAINSRLNVVVRSPTPFGLGRNDCWPSHGSQLPRALPSHKPFFSPYCPLNDRRRAAPSHFEVNRSPFFSHLLPLSFPPFYSFPLDEGQRSSQPGPHLSLLSVHWKCDREG